MKATISEKGQVTIPKRLRDRLGLRPGHVLDFEEADDTLVARKANAQVGRPDITTASRQLERARGAL